jgi:hypothetical protein
LRQYSRTRAVRERRVPGQGQHVREKLLKRILGVFMGDFVAHVLHFPKPLHGIQQSALVSPVDDVEHRAALFHVQRVERPVHFVG